MLKKFTNKTILSILAAIMAFTPVYAGAAGSSGKSADKEQSSELKSAVKAYAQGLIDQTLGILNDPNLSPEIKSQKCQDIMQVNMAQERVAEFALGKYQSQMTSEQLENFKKIFKLYLTKIYSKSAAIASNDLNVKLLSVVALSEKYVVKTKTSAQSVNIQDMDMEYIIVPQDGTYKVLDMLAQGVSILNAQKQQIQSLIQTRGIDETLANLKQSAETL